MKRLLIILTASFFNTLSFGQASKEKDFLQTLDKVVMALSRRDSVMLSNYTHKNTGVYIINRTGVVNSYKHFTTLGFSDSTYPNTPFYDGVKATPLKYARLPKYDCEKWTKTGTFVDSTQTDHLLSQTAKYLKKEFKENIPAKAINDLYTLENKSRRIVIAENNGNELIIYLSLINNKWMLTIIDKVTCDCST